MVCVGDVEEYREDVGVISLFVFEGGGDRSEDVGDVRFNRANGLVCTSIANHQDEEEKERKEKERNHGVDSGMFDRAWGWILMEFVGFLMTGAEGGEANVVERVTEIVFCYA